MVASVDIASTQQSEFSLGESAASASGSLNASVHVPSASVGFGQALHTVGSIQGQTGSDGMATAGAGGAHVTIAVTRWKANPYSNTDIDTNTNTNTNTTTLVASSSAIDVTVRSVADSVSVRSEQRRAEAQGESSVWSEVRGPFASPVQVWHPMS